MAEEIATPPASTNVPPHQEEDHEKARRLARIIVSDIALYNEQLLAEGRKNNNYHDLLKDDLEEGRSLFRQRVPKEIWEKRDYLTEIFDEFVETHTKTD